MGQEQDVIYIKHEPDMSAYEAPLIVDSPHSGTFYPKDFCYACAHDLLKRGEDLYVEELFQATPNVGGYFLEALFSRSYIDLNRAVDDIDPNLCAEHWQGEAKPSDRVKYGMGLIRRLVKPGVPVYTRKLTNVEIQRRIDHYYQPYHDELARLIKSIHSKFGVVFHLDVHSMPSRTLDGDPHPDFVIGDRDGQTSNLAFRNLVFEFLKDKGFNVTVNDPYKGVEIVRRYGAPQKGFNSLQIEINKKLYMDERSYKKTDGFKLLQDMFGELLSHMAAFTREQANSMMVAE